MPNFLKKVCFIMLEKVCKNYAKYPYIYAKIEENYAFTVITGILTCRTLLANRWDEWIYKNKETWIVFPNTREYAM